MPEVRIQVHDYELADLFYAMEFMDLVEVGCLTEYVDHRAVRTAKSCSGVSYPIRLRDKTGRSLALIHYLTCSSGETIPFPTMIRVGDARIYRIGHSPRPQAYAQSAAQIGERASD